MIVKNEEAVLERCLQDVSKFADELIMIDTGSVDRSKEIAGAFTQKIFDFAWRDDFAVARNASFENATSDYIMWIDADDRVEENHIQKLCDLKYRLHEKLVLAGYQRPENGGLFFYPRIVKRDAGFTWKGIIHEHLTLPEGKNLDESDVLTADFEIKHCKEGPPDYFRNISIMESIPEEELTESFWLCAQCFLDCTLAGEVNRADKYLKMASQSKTPFQGRLEDYALMNTVLKFHKKYDAMLKWNVMYLECKKTC
jgi:glycosyltransferase involved in cell wall biosynthesis